VKITQPPRPAGRLKLRMAIGCHRLVETVYAYDPNTRRALVKLGKGDYPGADQAPDIAEIQLAELEAIRDDDAGTYENVEETVKARAREVLPLF
jgi:hypothetical protein